MLKKLSFTALLIFLFTSCTSNQNLLQGKIRTNNINRTALTRAEMDSKFIQEHDVKNNYYLKKEIKKRKSNSKNINNSYQYGPIIKEKVKIGNSNFDAYSYNSGPKFRVVCEQKCKIAQGTLESKLKGARKAIELLVDFTKSNVPTQFEPVDIHLSSDSECGNYQEKLKKDGYVSNFYSISAGGGSYICLWEFDKPNILLAPGIDNSQKLESQNQVVHEYSHAILNKKVDAYMEDFVKVLSFYIAGNWDGNDKGLKNEENFPKLESACDENLNIEFGGKTIFDMCKKCGLEIEDIPKIIEKIDEIFYKGQGEIKYESLPSKLSISQLKKVADEVTGFDTEKDCGIDWSQV